MALSWRCPRQGKHPARCYPSSSAQACLPSPLSVWYAVKGRCAPSQPPQSSVLRQARCMVMSVRHTFERD